MLKDPAAWRLSVGGLVRTPLRLTLDDIQRIAQRDLHGEALHCVEGLERDRDVDGRAGECLGAGSAG